MATSKPKAGAVKTLATAINFTLLAIIATASASEVGYANVSQASAQPLADSGLVQINDKAEFKDADGNPAVRITDAGSKALAEHEQAKSAADVGGAAPGSNATSGGSEPAGDAPKTTRAAAASAFFIADNVPLPAGRSAPRVSGGSSYPFDALQIGQSFFIAATEDKPNVAKSMASTVTSANARHSTEIEGQTRVNRKGNIVPATYQTRQFIVRNVEDGAPWNQPGVKGAAVYRIALDSAESEEA